MGGCLSSEAKATSLARPIEETHQQTISAMIIPDNSATPAPLAASAQLPGSTPLKFEQTNVRHDTSLSDKNLWLPRPLSDLNIRCIYSQQMAMLVPVQY